jgi:hypothetical protein
LPGRPSLRRATRAAAAAPNRRTIGGAGTSVPLLPLLVELPPEVELLVLLDVDELPDDEELPEVEPLVLLDALAPKLLDPPVAPELVDEDEVEPVAPELVEVVEVEEVDPP